MGRGAKRSDAVGLLGQREPGSGEKETGPGVVSILVPDGAASVAGAHG